MVSVARLGWGGAQEAKCWLGFICWGGANGSVAGRPPTFCGLGLRMRTCFWICASSRSGFCFLMIFYGGAGPCSILRFVFAAQAFLPQEHRDLGAFFVFSVVHVRRIG